MQIRPGNKDYIALGNKDYIVATLCTVVPMSIHLALGGSELIMIIANAFL